MGGRFYGLVGTKLNVAIGVIAGLDFLYAPSFFPPPPPRD